MEFFAVIIYSKIFQKITLHFRKESAQTTFNSKNKCVFLAVRNGKLTEVTDNKNCKNLILIKLPHKMIGVLKRKSVRRFYTILRCSKF